MPNKYLQSGGNILGTLIDVLKFILNLVVKLFWWIIFPILKWIGKIMPKKGIEGFDYIDYKNWQFGELWVFMYYCAKSVIYLILFCFGGPVVIFIGVIYLYYQLGKKLNIRTDNLDISIDNKNKNSNKTNTK